MKKRILDMCCGSRMFYFDKRKIKAIPFRGTTSQ